MPWTRRQVKYLLSKGSPLSGGQRKKMIGELHADPAIGHKKKGSKALKRTAAHGLTSTRRGNQHMQSESYSYHH